MAFLELPVLVIENIFSYLSYDEIAKNRLVSKDFNEICMRLLNRGFLMIERRHAMALKSVKGQLPRRESERRYHPLARHCDILTSIETRISMLNMTYTKFIDNGICSFIPGKVIDEIRRVLSIVESSKTPPRAHEVLQELRDISSMAIEHFDDKISPAFRKLLQEGSSQPCPRPAQGTVDFSEDASIICAKFFDDRFNNEETAVTPMAIRQEMQHLRRRSVLNVKLSLYLAAQYKKYHNRMLDYKRFALAQHQTIRKMSKRQKQQYHEIADLKKRIEECDIKYSELTHTNQAAGGKAIAGNSSGSASGSQPLRHFGSQIKLDLSVLPIGTSKRHHSQALPNIKPRKPQIKLPSLSEDQNPKPDPNPAPSTSNQSPRTKSKSTMAKILGITNEIRHLSNLSKNFEGQLKRLADTEQEDIEAKKLKLD